MRTNLSAGTFEGYVFMEKVVDFGLFSGGKDDYIDVWMMKNTIKTNQIEMDVCFFQK